MNRPYFYCTNTLLYWPNLETVWNLGYLTDMFTLEKSSKKGNKNVKQYKAFELWKDYIT